MTVKGPARFETLSLKPSQVVMALEAMANTDVAVFVWGPPGIGKSQVMQQVAAKHGRPFIDLRLSQMDPTDLRGIPYPTEENGVRGMRWSAPLVLPRDPDSNAMIALEEFNAAPMSVVAASYQFVLYRLLGDYIVPKNCMLTATGNRETDKGIAFKMGTAISNRLVHIDMTPDFEEWQHFALAKSYHANVVAFLSHFKQDLWQFEPSTASRGFPTPRFWESVSKIMIANPDSDDQVSLGLIRGAVGEAAGQKFHAFKDGLSILPPIDDILSGKLKKVDKQLEPQFCYALVTNMCYELRRKNEELKRQHGKTWTTSPPFGHWLEQGENFLSFMMDNFKPDICIMGAKTAVGAMNLPFNAVKMKTFEKFTSHYSSLIIG